MFKKSFIFILMAAVLFMVPVSQATAANVQPQAMTAERSSETTDKLSCIFDAVLTMIQEIGACETAENVELCYVDAILTMFISVFSCTALDPQLSCIIDVIMEGIDDLTLCQDIGCVLSTVFSMVIDIISCIETSAAAV